MGINFNFYFCFCVFSSDTHSFQLENDFERKHVEHRYNFKCNCCHCSDEEPSPPPTMLNVDEDSVRGEVATAIDMSVKDRALSPEAIKQYEQKAIELGNYSNIYPNHDVLFIREYLMLIWILPTQSH